MTNPNEKEKDIHTRWAEYCQEEGRGLTKWRRSSRFSFESALELVEIYQRDKLKSWRESTLKKTPT